MDIAVLGPLRVNGSSDLLTHRDRVVLAALVAGYGQAVPRDTLAEALWGEAVPDSHAKIVQGCVVRLRKLLGPGTIVTSERGYSLRAHADSIDAQRFERLLASARDLLADGEPDRAAYLTGQALDLWHGRALPDLEDWPPGQAESARLEEIRLDAEDIHTEAALRTGHHREILSAALRRATQAPLRERRWALLAMAQYQSGRQSDALLTLRRARTMLVSEQGLDPSPELADLEAAILRQDPQLAAGEPILEPSDQCPYPGLLPFGVDDAGTFFGREADIAACLERLDTTGILAVVGPSGCGKTSLVRAGVAAVLARDGRRVSVQTPGARPLDALQESLSASGPTAAPTVLVVDQCEEALADDVDLQERSGWVEALVQHAERGDLVIALRADRIGTLSAHPGLARLVERGLYVLGGMQEEDLRTAVEGPARHAGLRLEPGLTDLLVHEVRGEPGALPLLSHALRQTWLRREGATLTVAGYRATGGVREALTQSADGLYERLEPPQRAMLRDLMLRLVSPSSDGEPTRARVARRHVAADPARAELVEQLVAARLVSSDDETVEIAHEALAREWPRLRTWLEEDVEGQRILRHLAVAADTWDSMGRPDSELYRGIRLGRALEWQTTSASPLSSAETEFLDASERAAAAEREAEAAQVRKERRWNRRLRVLLAVAAVFALTAAGLGAVATGSANRAEAQALSADARRVGAEALTAPRPDTSLLLAVAGMGLEHNSDSAKSNLAAALDRSPLLVHVARTPPAGSIAVDPSSGRVALSLTAGGLNLYDGRTLRVVGHSKDGDGGATAFSPNGRILAVSDVPRDLSLPTPNPQPIHLVNPAGTAPPAQLGGMPYRFRSFWSMAFSADGRRFAAPLFGISVGRINLTVWDPVNPQIPVAVVTPNNAHMTSLTISADGRTLYTTGDYYLRVFDVATGVLRAQRTGPQLGLKPLPYHDQAWTPEVVMSPDGKTLAVSAETEVALLDPVTLKRKARLDATGRITSLAFSANSRRLVIADGGVEVWDLVGKKPVDFFPSPDGDSPQPTQMFRAQTWGGDMAALSPDGNTVYAARQAGELLAWDLTGTHGFVTTHPGPALPNDAIAVGVSPDGRKVAYLANVYARLFVRDVDKGRLVEDQYPDGNNVYGGALTWRPDGRAVLGVAGDSTIEVRDPGTGGLINRRTFGDGVSAAEYTPDGRLVIGTNQGHMRVVDANSLHTEVDPGEWVINERVQTLAVDPAEHAVAIEGSTQRVLVDYVSGDQLRTLPYLTFFAPDGSTSAVVDDNGAVGFQADHGTRWIAPPDPSHAYGDSLSAYSHDSTWFASSHNNQVGLWNARTGTFVGSIPVTGQVAVGFTADDSTLVIAGLDGSVQTWNLNPDAWIRSACDIAGRDLTAQEWGTALPQRTQEHICHTVGP